MTATKTHTMKWKITIEFSMTSCFLVHYKYMLTQSKHLELSIVIHSFSLENTSCRNTFCSKKHSSTEPNWTDFTVWVNWSNLYLSSLMVWQWQRKSSSSTAGASTSHNSVSPRPKPNSNFRYPRRRASAARLRRWTSWQMTVEGNHGSNRTRWGVEKARQLIGTMGGSGFHFHGHDENRE